MNNPINLRDNTKDYVDAELWETNALLSIANNNNNYNVTTT